MKVLTVKGLLVAGATLASVAAWGENVESTATLNANLDTREMPLVVSEPEGVFALAWNNTADWRLGGDTSGAAATVTATPMLALPGPGEGWIPSGEPTTLVNAQTGEGVKPFAAQDATGYRFVFTVGESSVTSYVAVAAQGLDDRAAVTIDGSAAPVADAPLTAAATALEGKIVGDCTYAWYRYDFDQAWYEGEVVSSDVAYTPTADDYEMFLRVLVTDADGYVAFGPAIWFSKLPVIYIETEGHQPANKADIGATMTMQGNDKFTNTKQLYSGALKMHIRGNTTSDADKKPYKIKLGSKCDLLGMGKQKHWTLLSNPYDISLMRNKVIYDLSAQLGLTAMASEWADVILNGEFVGNYQVCEHIRVGETRVDIYDWEDKADKVAKKIADAKRDATKPAPTEDVPDPEPTMTEEEYEALLSDLETYLEQNLQWITTGSFVYKNETYVLSDYGENIATYDTTGGYLFELDPFADEVSMFNSGTADGKLNMLIKANRPEYLKTNPEMYGYVQDVWSSYWAAIVSPDGYHNGQHFSELCDIDSMTGYWLAQVIPAQGDHQWSRYAYIPQQKGITWGPAWDFDNACGGRSINWVVTEGSGVTGGRGVALNGWSLGTMTAQTLFYCHWNNDPRFVQLLVEKFQQVTPYLDNLLKDGGAFDEMYDYLLESGVANARRWAGRMGGSYAVTAGTRFDDYPGVAGPNGYGDAHWFKYVLKNRVEWIKSQFTSVRAGVTSLGAAKTGANPYTDTVGDFTLDIDGESLDRPDSKEGATPDKIVPAGDLVATVGVATEGAKRLAVYVNGLLNGTYTIVKGSANIEVTADELKVGERNMLSFAALDAGGNRLATSYALLTVVEPAKFPQSVADLEDATIEVETMGYTGAPLTPAVTLKTVDGTTLVADVDYTVSYSNNVHYGLATVTVTGTGNPTGEGEFGENGNWIGTRTFTFEIVENIVSAQTKRTDLDTREPQVYVVSNASEILAFAYNNATTWPRGGDTSSAAASVVVTMMSGDPAADPATWTETSGLDTLETPSAEGRVFWAPEGKALFKAELTDADGVKTRAYYNLFDCEGLGISLKPAVIELSVGELVYTGEEQRPNVTVTYGDTTLVEGQDYIVTTVSGGTDAGLATLLIQGIGAYAGGREVTYKIQPQPATLGAVALDTREPQVYVVSNASEILDFAYNNKAAWPRGGDPSAAAASVVVMTMMSGDPTADPTTWTETSGLDTLDAPLAEGTTVWCPEAKALYRAELTDADGVKTRAYYNLLDCEGLGKSIRRATVTLSAEDLTYTGEQLKPEITVELEGVTLVEGQDYTVTVTDNVNAGLATITIRGTGAYVGETKTTKTFRIQPAPATLTADLDTRELAVRKPASVDEILALAWNNTSAWRKGGDTAGTAVVLALTPMAGEDPSDPTTWTEDGAARTLVSAAGEGANVWTRPAAKLYKATLVGGTTLAETAYFDLSDLELPPDPVERLAEIFGDKATVEMMPDGIAEVTLTDDLEEPLELPDDLGKVRINLNDHDLVGTGGDAESPDGTAAITIAKGEGLDAPTALELTGGDVTGGAGFSPAGGGVSGDGGPAILVADDATATVLVDADASVTGGKGGDSDTGDPGEGGLGIVPPEALDPASEGTVAQGERGKDNLEVPIITIVKALQRYPWNGKIDIDFTAVGPGARYDLSLTLAAGGQSWTATAANLSGDVELTDGMTADQKRRVTWDAAADCGTAVVDKNATLTLTAKRVR